MGFFRKKPDKTPHYYFYNKTQPGWVFSIKPGFLPTLR